MATTVEEMAARFEAIRSMRCSMCSHTVKPGNIVLIGDEAFDPACAIVAAASIASTVEDGGDESARDVAAAAEILDRAARSLRSRIAGRA